MPDRPGAIRVRAVKRIPVNWGRLLLLLVGAVVVLGPVVLAGASLFSRADKSDRQDDIQCQSGNLSKAYELTNRSDGRFRRGLAEDLLPIIDCARFVQDGIRVPVSRTVQGQYVRIVVRQRVWPLVGAGGLITGEIPLPSAAQRP